MRTIIYFVLAVAVLLSSCATFKSGMENEFTRESEKNYNSDKVDVLFIFQHYRQTIGLDAIPKLDSKYDRIKGFDDFFIDAMNEISNIDNYSSYTEYASDVSDFKRRAVKDSLKQHNDLVVQMKFLREKSFSKFFFGSVVSVLSATIIPMNYKYRYSLEACVYDSEGKLVKTYTRKANLNKWVQCFMVFLYPFHPEKRKKEDLYVDFMHDVFEEMETEKVLSK